MGGCCSFSCRLWSGVTKDEKDHPSRIHPGGWSDIQDIPTVPAMAQLYVRTRPVERFPSSIYRIIYCTVRSLSQTRYAHASRIKQLHLGNEAFEGLGSLRCGEMRDVDLYEGLYSGPTAPHFPRFSPRKRSTTNGSFFPFPSFAKESLFGVHRCNAHTILYRKSTIPPKSFRVTSSGFFEGVHFLMYR